MAWYSFMVPGGSAPTADALQPVAPNYEGMYNASPTGYNALQTQRQNSTGLDGVLPNYAGMEAASPTGFAGRQGAGSDWQEKLQSAAGAIKPPGGGDTVGNMFRAQAGAAPTGLLDFYQESMAQQFKPVQSQQGLLSMPRYNFAGAK